MKWLFILMIIYRSAFVCVAQEKKSESLQEVIAQAQFNSPRYKLAQTQKEVRYFQFLMSRSDLRPQISLYGNAPVYSKQYTSIVQPDGDIKFLPIQQNLNRAGFSLSQEIPFTGGRLSLSTELNHFYNFQSKSNQFNGIPVFLQFTQPLFGFSSLRWQKKIAPLLLEESKREYIFDMENIAEQTVVLYFDKLDAQSNVFIAEANVVNTAANLKIEKKRVEFGTTTEDKLLQLQLQSLISKQDLDKARYDMEVASLALRTFIGNKEKDTFELAVPEKIPVFDIELSEAMEYARQNRPEYIAFERKKLESERDLAQAKAAQQEVGLSASYGLNRAASNLTTIYNDPRDQQTFSIGFNVPIVDWGRRKARYNTAKTIKKLTEYNNDIEESSLRQQLTTLVENITLLRGSIQLAEITDSIAKRRFDIANNLYKVGKLSISDLNIAQSEKDNARRTFIASLRGFWSAFYQLRKLTMYDVETKTSLYK